MITSDRQLKVTKENIISIEKSLEKLNNKANKTILTMSSTVQTKAKLEDLIAEVEEYEKLCVEGLEAIELNTPEDFFLLPIRYRIAKKLTQEAFANEVEIAVRQIARYEASEYSNINGETLKQILSHIPITLETTLSEAPST